MEFPFNKSLEASMSHLFPYDNIVIGILIFIVGFLFHWIGQLVSIVNWEFATKIGLQELNMPKEYIVYEHAIAVADSIIGWIYGLAALGLILGIEWGYKLAWFPGVILIYHSLSFWFWTSNRRKAGHVLTPAPLRIGWTIANFVTGALTVLFVWNAV
jgi:hypothetical protein